MKLVIDLRLINSSGIGTYLKNVIPGMIVFFEEVIALGNKEELSNFEWSNSIKIISFPYKVYGFLEQLYYPIKIPKCDFFWSPHFNAPLFPVKSEKRIVTIYDVNHLTNVSYYNYIKRTWAKVLYKNATKSSDVLFTISEFSKSEILKYFPGNEHKIN